MALESNPILWDSVGNCGSAAALHSAIVAPHLGRIARVRVMLHRRIAAPSYVSEYSLTYVAAPNAPTWCTARRA